MLTLNGFSAQSPRTGVRVPWELRFMKPFASYRLEPYWSKGTCCLRCFTGWVVVGVQFGSRKRENIYIYNYYFKFWYHYIYIYIYPKCIIYILYSIIYFILYIILYFCSPLHTAGSVLGLVGFS